MVTVVFSINACEDRFSFALTTSKAAALNPALGHTLSLLVHEPGMTGESTLREVMPGRSYKQN